MVAVNGQTRILNMGESERIRSRERENLVERERVKVSKWMEAAYIRRWV